MNLLTALILGIVQGLTEFLPVSSSAHLILGRSLLGFDTDRLGLPFDVACHVGTLLAIVAFFRADLGALVRALPRLVRTPADPDVRRLRLIVMGTLPVVVVGLFWTDAVAAMTRTPVVAASALLAGAGLLLYVERRGSRGLGEEALSPIGALAIGVAQSAALIPGVSRSGATIAAGMALGLRRDAAARFTFLMSVPAVLGAAAKEGLALRRVPLGVYDVLVFGVGLVTSALVGYVTVKYLLRFLVTHRLDVFAWYRVALALATFAWLAAR